MPKTQCPYCFCTIHPADRTGDFEGQRCHAHCVVVQLQVSQALVAAEAA